LSGPIEEDSIWPLNSVSAYDYIQSLYRLCLIQSGSDNAAESAVHDLLSEAFKTANRDLAKVDFDGLFRTAFQRRDSYAKMPENKLTDWPRVLHSLAEPQRSTLTLFYLEIWPLSFIAEITGSSIEQLADTIKAARSALPAAADRK
jgi:DNA-directed RNA polymerase specialized sigma24 family protein